ncbi:MAG: recombination mediator RecR [Verrucomicrobiota bacterium]
MIDYPPAVRRLITVLKELPTIGPRSAERLAVHILQADPALSRAMGEALGDVRENIYSCSKCGFFSEEADNCEICRDPRRSTSSICVVEDATDIIAVEKSQAFHGQYHVLGGTLSPLDEIGPDDLNIESLVQRITSAEPAVEEIIIALDTDVRGETTSIYLAQQFKESEVKITRPAQGISVGGSLEYADGATLSHAFSDRKTIL